MAKFYSPKKGIMAKGLSKLQRSILKLAYANRDEIYRYGCLNNREVLIRLYGFKPACGTEHKRNGTQVFNRRTIGLRRYMAASVATVKSFNRIADHKLAIRKHNFGVILNKNGATIAKNMG